MAQIESIKEGLKLVNSELKLIHDEYCGLYLLDDEAQCRVDSYNALGDMLHDMLTEAES
jgi:hypothetical protein